MCPVIQFKKVLGEMFEFYGRNVLSNALSTLIAKCSLHSSVGKYLWECIRQQRLHYKISLLFPSFIKVYILKPVQMLNAALNT